MNKLAYELGQKVASELMRAEKEAFITSGLFGTAHTAGGQEALRASSKASQAFIDAAEKTRKKNFGQYLFNPSSMGPLSELWARAGRRSAEGALANPTLSAFLPGAGLILGGD